MPPVDRAADGYALALDEARRALDEQERAVAQLSTRAGLLISAAAIVTSFLGGPVLARDALDVAGWIAIAAFVGLTIAALTILRPRRDFEFGLHPGVLIGSYLETATTETPSSYGLRRELALNMGESMTRNEAELARMMTTFNIGSVFLAIEIFGWVVSIATAG
ncbi:MAG: hypothetical protein ACTHOE_05750 [Conexibacter sp.]